MIAVSKTGNHVDVPMYVNLYIATLRNHCKDGAFGIFCCVCLEQSVTNVFSVLCKNSRNLELLNLEGLPCCYRTRCNCVVTTVNGVCCMELFYTPHLFLSCSLYQNSVFLYCLLVIFSSKSFCIHLLILPDRQPLIFLGLILS